MGENCGPQRGSAREGGVREVSRKKVCFTVMRKNQSVPKAQWGGVKEMLWVRREGGGLLA